MRCPNIYVPPLSTLLTQRGKASTRYGTSHFSYLRYLNGTCGRLGMACLSLGTRSLKPPSWGGGAYAPPSGLHFHPVDPPSFISDRNLSPSPFPSLPLRRIRPPPCSSGVTVVAALSTALGVLVNVTQRHQAATFAPDFLGRRVLSMVNGLRWSCSASHHRGSDISDFTAPFRRFPTSWPRTQEASTTLWSWLALAYVAGLDLFEALRPRYSVVNLGGYSDSLRVDQAISGSEPVQTWYEALFQQVIMR